MKRYYMIFITCLLTTTTIAIAGKSRTIEGTIFAYECGDNCYLTIVDNKGKEHTGLCTAPSCQKWNEVSDMPIEFKGKKVKINIGKGLQLDGEGNVMGEMDAFKKIQFIKTSSVSDASKLPFIGARFFDFGDGTI